MGSGSMRRGLRLRESAGLAVVVVVVAVVSVALGTAVAAPIRESAGASISTGAASRHVVVYATAVGRVTPISAATDRVRDRIHVPGLPVAMAVTPNGQRVFIASMTSQSKAGLITQVRVSSDQAQTPIKVPPDPTGIAISPDGQTAYVASELNPRLQSPGRITPIDVATGRTSKPIKVGIDPGPVLFTPSGKTAYVLNFGFNSQSGHAFLTPITVATGHAGKPIALPISDDIIQVAMAPNGRTVYAVGIHFPSVPPTTSGSAGHAGPSRAPGQAAARPTGRLVPVSTVTNKVGSSIRLPGDSAGLAIAPGSRLAYVVDDPGTGSGPGAAFPVNLVTGQVGRSVPVKAGSEVVAFTPNGHVAYVLGPGAVVPIRARTDTAERAIRAAKTPVAIAFTPDSKKAFVLSSPVTIKGDHVSFDRSWVIPIVVARDRAGKPIPVGRGGISIAVVP
jgi:DNA-binding beta-propeller fold protein YncE